MLERRRARGSRRKALVDEVIGREHLAPSESDEVAELGRCGPSPSQGTGRASELHRSRAHSAGCAVNQQPVAGLQAALVNSASCAVVKASGSPPALGQSSLCGTGMSMRS